MLLLDITIVNVALPKIAQDFQSNLSGLQWVIDAYTLALASLLLTAGILADRSGRKLLFLIGMESSPWVRYCAELLPTSSS